MNWVEDTKNQDPKVQEDAVYKIFHEVISATSSMTSLPKPMKFLGPSLQHFGRTVQQDSRGKGKGTVMVLLLAIFRGLALAPKWHPCGGLTNSRCTSTSKKVRAETSLLWGHEFQLQLAGDISKIYDQRLDTKEDTTVEPDLKPGPC